MWGDINPNEMIEELERNLRNSNSPGEAQVVSDPKHIEHMLSVMLDKMRPRSSSSSSDSSDCSKEDKARKHPGHERSKAPVGGHIRPKRKNAVKPRSYKDDKTDFDSYNVFNRSPPPDIGPHPLPEIKKDVVQTEGEVRNSEEGPNVANRDKTDVKAKTTQNRKTPQQTEKAPTKRPKRPKRSVRAGKNLKMDLKKRPISQKTARENETRLRRYCECRMSTKERVKALSQELKRHLEDEGRTRKPKVEAGDETEGDVLYGPPPETSDPLTASMAGSTPEQQLDFLRALVEMRSRKETTGHLWDSAVIFIDQGLAYNQIAKERRIWETRWGIVTSDVNDPATDAVLMTGLSLGALIFPKRSDQNPFDFTNSFLDAMMEKYPVLCKPDENKDEPDYAACLRKFALTFPLLITTFFVFSDGPKMTPVTAKDYGLPAVVYYQGFPSLACQHLLEKDTNILPFLMIGLLHHLGDKFRDCNLKQRLCLAWIVWKHLKKMIDSSSLPWVCRESFCRRHGVCKNQDYRPDYLPRRLEAQQHIASSVAKSNKLYKLLVEIDEFDFRRNCPAVNSLAVSIADIHYMNVFYTVAVEELKEGTKRDENESDGARDSDASDTLAVIEKNLRKTEEELILEAASIEKDRAHSRKSGGKNKFAFRLEDEID